MLEIKSIEDGIQFLTNYPGSYVKLGHGISYFVSGLGFALVMSSDKVQKMIGSEKLVTRDEQFTYRLPADSKPPKLGYWPNSLLAAMFDLVVSTSQVYTRHNTEVYLAYHTTPPYYMSSRDLAKMICYRFVEIEGHPNDMNVSFDSLELNNRGMTTLEEIWLRTRNQPLAQAVRERREALDSAKESVRLNEIIAETEDDGAVKFIRRGNPHCGFRVKDGCIFMFGFFKVSDLPDAQEIMSHVRTDIHP